MGQVPQWFQRTFDFSYQVELYPNLAVRLRGTPARLEEITRARSREILVRKETEKWSAQEHAGHLLDLEPLWLKRVEDFVNGGTDLTATDLTNRKTDEANHNSRGLAEILSEFRSARFALIARLETMDARLHASTMLHPRLKKPMRLVDHLYFVAEHDDHHLAQIWELTT